jgi:endo-1,4-beta-xylanase
MALLSVIVAMSLVASTRQEAWNVLANSDFKDKLSDWTTNGTYSIINESDTRFVKFKIGVKPSRAWDILLTQGFALPDGSPVTIRITARSQTRNKITAMVEEATSPHTKFISQDFNLTPKWETYTVSGALTKGSGIHANLHLSHSQGEVDIREFAVLSTAKRTPVKQYPIEFIRNNDFAAGFDKWFTEGATPPTVKPISVNGQKFASALEVDVNNPNGNAWDCQIGQLLEEGSSKGETVFAKVWLRTSDKVRATLVYELNQPPHDKELYELVQPNAKWAEYTVPMTLQNGFAPGKAQFKLFFLGKGKIEVGPVSLTNRGRSYVGGSLPVYLGGSEYKTDPAWRKEADARINKIRKGSFTVLFRDATGKPLKNQTVQVSQAKHHFRFGTAAAANYFIQQDNDGVKYREAVKRVFNTITFDNDLKWDSVGPEVFENKILPAQKWLAENGIALRGHNLVWGSAQYLPGNVMGMSKEDAWKTVEAHVNDYSKRMKGKVYLWDVVNEAHTETELWNKIGWDKFAEVYKIARKNDPTAKLCYNDYNISTNDKHREGAIARANQIKSLGASVDVFGDQSHLSAPGVDPRKLWSVWDEVHAKTGLPIEITELDLTTLDDGFQAAYLSDFYRAAFSHPNLEAVILWGFWERNHWLANRGAHLVKEDWTWRPAMKAIDNLINKEWRTEGTFKTDAKGMVTFSGFYGDYDLSIDGQKVRVPFQKLQNAKSDEQRLTYVTIKKK